ncbi:MAG: DinB family protein [Candidatus Rokuibacteriota bacterium]
MLSADHHSPTGRSRRTPLGAKSDALAKQFEAKAQEAAAILEKLSEADWTKVTAAEKWTVGVTAHHLASVLEPIAGIVTAIVSGQSLGNFTGAMVDEMNAKHAKEHAHCTKAETIALQRKGAAAAAAVVRGLSDDQLGKSATVFTDAPPMTAEQVVTSGLITHIDEHFGSIRETVGN